MYISSFYVNNLNITKVKKAFQIFPNIHLFIKEYRNLIKQENIKPKFNIQSLNFIQNNKYLEKEKIDYKKPLKLDMWLTINDVIYNDIDINYEYFIFKNKTFSVIEINSFFVNILFQRQGYGSKLIDLIKDIISPDLIVVNSLIYNALPFYLKNDFLLDFSEVKLNKIRKEIETRYKNQLSTIYYINNKFVVEYLQRYTLYKISADKIYNLPDNILNEMCRCVWLNEEINILSLL